MTPLKRQSGAALLMVLLIVALVSLLAVQLSERLQTPVLRTANLQQSEQAYFYWLSAEELVTELLQRELEEDDGVVHRQQQWYLQSQNAVLYPVDGGNIGGQIKDQSTCFNLNALKVENNESLLTRRKVQLRMLLLAVAETYREGRPLTNDPNGPRAESREIGLDGYTVDVIVESLADWLDADEQINGSYGAESPDYESLSAPYRAANNYLVDVSEFRLIRGVTPVIYRALKPYICVIPFNSNWSVNVNTVADTAPEILHAASVGAMTVGEARQLLSRRPTNGYKNLDDVISAVGSGNIQPNYGGVRTQADAKDLGKAVDDLAVTSEYFVLDATVTYGDFVMQGRSLLHVNGQQSEVVSRAVGEN